MGILAALLGAMAGLTILLLIGMVYDTTHDDHIKPYEDEEERE